MAAVAAGAHSRAIARGARRGGGSCGARPPESTQPQWPINPRAVQMRPRCGARCTPARRRDLRARFIMRECVAVGPQAPQRCGKRRSKVEPWGPMWPRRSVRRWPWARAQRQRGCTQELSSVCRRRDRRHRPNRAVRGADAGPSNRRGFWGGRGGRAARSSVCACRGRGVDADRLGRPAVAPPIAAGAICGAGGREQASSTHRAAGAHTGAGGRS